MKHWHTINGFNPQIPPAWTEVLKQVTSVCGTAYIAGGALRDLVCDKPVKDVDIFVNPSLDYDVIEKFFDTYGYNNTSSPGSCNGIEDAWSVDHFYVPHANQSFELIQFRLQEDVRFTQRSLLSRFDFGICQISCGAHYVYMHQNFIHALKYRVIKQVNREHPDIAAERLGRLQKKFPDFTVEMLDGNVQAAEASLHDR